MQEYIAFFKDGHIQLGGKPTSVNTKDPVAVKQLHDATEKLQLSAEDLTRISSSKGIEGIYYNQDSTYKIALVVKKRLLAHT
jgi:hypothetical protein